jgi:hypothetical protein
MSRGFFKILTGKPTGKRPLGRPRCRWEDNIRKDLKEIGINSTRFISRECFHNFNRYTYRKETFRKT